MVDQNGYAGQRGPEDPTADEVELDRLLHEVLRDTEAARDERTRWQLLLDAVVSMGQGLSLDGLLDRIVAIAGRLAQAQYAALGVLDVGSERRLQTFIYHGISPEQAERIGPLPEGHGLLGQLIDHPEPLRLRDVAEHRASYGFPEHHPPMRTFLGVPVRVRNRVFGNLYLTEKEGGADFTEQDEQIVVALAAAAGVAIENAQLYEALNRRERWLIATTEITADILDASSTVDPLQTVADKALDVAEADAVWIIAGEREEDLHVAVLAGPDVDIHDLRAVPLNRTRSQQVLESGEPLVVEDYATDPRALRTENLVGWPVLGPVVLVPLRGAAGPVGVLVLGWTREHAHRQHVLDPDLPLSFAEQAALAMQVVHFHRDRQRLALFEDRDRIARDLHDVVIQRLFALGLALQGAARVAGNEALTERLSAAVDDLDTTIRDIRRTIFELGAAPGADDVQAEVTRMVERAAATLKTRPTLYFEGPVRTMIGHEEAADVLAVLSEALSNAARHAHATRVDVRLSVDRDIVLEVTDNGPGIPDGAVESGLRNMRLRAERRGGRFLTAPGPAGGTRVRWSIPVR